MELIPTWKNLRLVSALVIISFKNLIFPLFSLVFTALLVLDVSFVPLLTYCKL